jgi:hypothetical protein
MSLVGKSDVLRVVSLVTKLRQRWFVLPLALAAAAFVYMAFVFPQPDVRIVLRTAPVVPFAIWAVYLDPRRSLRTAPPARRLVGQAVLLVVTVLFAVLVLGLGLNWVFDPARVV